ncbi:MAG: DUF6069 family protein [Acidimicrobiia bacterium]
MPLVVGGQPAKRRRGGLWVLQKVTSGGFRVWTIRVAVVMVVSLAGPIALDVDTASKVVVSVMHFVVGGAAVAGQLVARGR